MNNLAVYIGLIIGIYLGYHEAKIREEFNLLKDKLTEKKAPNPTVITTRPELPREPHTNPSHYPTGVVSQKTPQEIDFQEVEELRRMNPGS